LFVDFRWADNGGKPYCPRCGCLEPYSVRRRRFPCSEPECRAEFSVTSGTVFANRKLSFKKIIMAIWEEITAAKGMAALHLSRKLNVQYKTAYVLLQKLREAVGLRRDAIKLQGTVQIDGKYVGGVLRKANKKEERKNGRKRENQNGKRMCVLALREANRHAPNRTLTRVIMDENGKDAWSAVAKHVDPKALLVADKRDISPTHLNAAAIDIGATMHVAAVGPDQASEPVRSFGTFTGDLHRLADWFTKCGVRTVAMESTGVYWIPVFEIFDQRGFEVIVVNARDAKHVPGRKTDIRLATPNGCSVCMNMDCSGPASG